MKIARSPGAARKRDTRRRVGCTFFGAPWITPALDVGAACTLEATPALAEGCGFAGVTSASSRACHQLSSATTPHAVAEMATIDPRTHPTAMRRFFHHGRRRAERAVSKTFISPCVPLDAIHKKPMTNAGAI